MLREIRARRQSARKAATQHFAEARFEGTGKLQADLRQRGMRMVWVDDATGEGAALAARAHRAIQDRKAKQDDFEREVAFQYFNRLPPGELASHRVAAIEMDRIARTIFNAPSGRRSLEETRRRVGELRGEFLGLRS
jgi:hypothetical protein